MLAPGSHLDANPPGVAQPTLQSIIKCHSQNSVMNFLLYSFIIRLFSYSNPLKIPQFLYQLMDDGKVVLIL